MSSPTADTVYLKRQHDELRFSMWPSADIWRRTRRHSQWHLTADACIRLQPLLDELREAHAQHSQLGLFTQVDAGRPCAPGALLDLLQEIPLVVREVVARYRARQHPLLQIAAAHRFGWQLVADRQRGGNPGLAFGLADRVARTRDWAVRQELAAAVRMRRAEIARLLGFPYPPIAVRVLARVAPTSASRTLMREVHAALMNPSARAILAQAKRVSGAGVALLQSAELREVVTPTLVDDMADLPDNSAATVLDCPTRYRREMRRQGLRLVPVHRSAQLWDLLERLEGDVRDLRFPPPPFQLPDGALRYSPLTSFRAVQEEGQLMRHCAASYVRRVVLMRKCYLYRIEGAVRATMRVERVGRRWRVAEVRGEGNVQVAEGTLSTVRAAVRGVQVRR